MNPQTLNLYSYVRNNPLRYVDPTGHQEQKRRDPKKDIENPDCTECDVLYTDYQEPKKPSPPPSRWDNFTQQMWRFDFAVPRYLFKFEKFSFAPVSTIIRTVGGEQAHRNYVDATMALLPLAVEARTEAAIDGEIDELMEVTIENANIQRQRNTFSMHRGQAIPAYLRWTEKVRPREERSHSKEFRRYPENNSMSIRRQYSKKTVGRRPFDRSARRKIWEQVPELETQSVVFPIGRLKSRLD